MEKWIKWAPLNEIPSNIYTKSVCDSKDGLIITFEDEQKEKSIVFTFDGFVFSYRNTDEGVFLKTLSYLEEYYDSSLYNGTFFKIEDSDYLSWFHKESLGSYQNQKVIHFVFYTSDEIIEVLSSSEPQVQII